MTLADWTERLKTAARAFAATANAETEEALQTAAYGYGYWREQLSKAVRREKRVKP